MGICLCHASALSVMRSGHYESMVAEWGDWASSPPSDMPGERALRAYDVTGTPLELVDAPYHLLVSSSQSACSNPLAVRHVCTASLPAGSIMRLSADVSICSPELVCLQMARTCSDLELVVLISELVGYYYIDELGGGHSEQRNRPLTTVEGILKLIDAVPGIHGAKRVRRALERAIVGSASPMETKLALRLGLPPREGGYGFDIVSMNESTEIARIESPGTHKRRPDILLKRPVDSVSAPSMGVIVEYDGVVHVTEEREVADAVRRNELLAHGFKPYTIKCFQYNDLEYMDGIAQVFAKDLGIELAGMKSQRAKRARLATELSRIDGVHWHGRTK